MTVAAEHYLQVPEEHFAKAAQDPAQYVAVKSVRGRIDPRKPLEFSGAYDILP